VPCTKGGQIDRAHQASLESATLRSLSERLTLVTAVTGILLRHGCKIPRPPYSTFMVILLLIYLRKTMVMEPVYNQVFTVN
jgi:hypothetical protein